MGSQKHKKSKKSKKTLASKADRYRMYLASVQAPDVDVRFFQRVYRKEFGERPEVLREDFCGTAAVCCEWVKLKGPRSSFGVDMDPEPLAWGRENNRDPLAPKQQARVHLVEGDVRTAETPPADIIAAQNFSYCCFKTRDELRTYLEATHRHLADKGVVILDLFGGYESIEDNREEVTEHAGFDYVWDQAEYDPITAECLFHIHFRFADGSEMEEAFSYDWRLWTIPEVRELLIEAGFSRADAYWEGVDKRGEGNGIYRKAEKGTSDPAWNAYIVGVKA